MENSNNQKNKQITYNQIKQNQYLKLEECSNSNNSLFTENNNDLNYEQDSSIPQDHLIKIIYSDIKRL